MERFKAISRQIFIHDVKQEQAPWFRMEKIKELRRLGKLGITGNQPAIAAHVAMTTEERRRVTRCIMMQKVGNNTKDMKQYDEHVARINEMQQEEERPRTRHEVEPDQNEPKTDWLTRDEEKIVVKINRIAMGTAVKWPRRTRKEELHDDHEGGRYEEHEEKQNYSSRLLACTRCGAQQETKSKQLRTAEGYRAIHCRACGKQERTAHNCCTCGIIWHQCMIHRVDPPIHTSRKGNVDKVAIKGRSEEGKQLSSRRKTPAIVASNAKGHSSATGRRRRRNDQDANVIGHVKFKASTAKPKQEIIDRLRRRLAVSDNSIKCKDDGNLNAAWSRNKQHTIGDSKAGQSAKLEDEKGHRVCSHEMFVDHLMKLAASQTYDKGKCLKKDVNVNKVYKNSVTSMCKGRTYIVGSLHRRADETNDRGSIRSRAASAEEAIARLLNVAAPSRPSSDQV